ncbi:MAG: hypothetical protein ACYC7E_16665 [Armatimonadota bacterium]
MPKQTMRRSVADNQYLHKDFHGALSHALDYLHERYGEEAVREYLRAFARAYYAPVTQGINERGLAALQEHLGAIYTIEGGEVFCALTENALDVEVPCCPAVSYLREQGHPVARLFEETGRTVYATICEGTPFMLEWETYDAETGGSRFRFVRRPA